MEYLITAVVLSLILGSLGLLLNKKFASKQKIVPKEKYEEHDKFEDQVASGYLDALRKYIGLKLLLLIIILSALGIFLIVLGFEKSNISITYYILNEVGKALFITALISGSIKWYMTRQASTVENERKKIIENELSTHLRQLKTKVLEQTDKVSNLNLSLSALKQCGINRVYSNRSEAANDIKEALERDSVNYIKIIGISLNDFVRDEQKNFNAACKLIEDYVEKGNKPKKVEKLDIKILLVDPLSQGAYLRSAAEEKDMRMSDIDFTEDNYNKFFQDEDQRFFNIREKRLFNDVYVSMKYFHNLEKKQQNNDVTLEVRIYRTPPILYLVSTPHVSFYQQYYFRPNHRSNINIPVSMLSKNSEPEKNVESVHEELNFHFDWLWHKGSVSLREYFDEYCVGNGEAIRQAGIENIYYDSELCKKRILQMINDQNNKKLWVKGISLHSFFCPGELYHSLCNRLRKQDIDIKILLLDPESEQAKIRSYREYLLTTHQPIEFKEFTQCEYKNQRLFRDTSESIKNIRMDIIGKNYCSQADNKEKGFEARKYNSAPEAFILITDDLILVEQYHYGKIIPPGNEGIPTILCGDVPVIEYRRNKISTQQEFLKEPYRIFEDHFKHVFNYCAKKINKNKT